MGNYNNKLSNVLIDNEKLNNYVNKHLEYLKHRSYKCYKCGKRGHIASECEHICIKCGVPHQERFCIGEITQFIVEVNYVQCSLLKDFRKDCRKLSSVELVKKLRTYVERVTDKIERQFRGNAKMDQKNIFSHPREKPTNDIIEDFKNLFQLQGIQTICNSHSELIKAYKTKIENLKMESQKLADERRAVIKEEQFKFMEAKKKGVRALINYKLSKQKYKEKLTNIEKKFAKDFKYYTTQIEEEMAFNKLKQMEESKRNVGYMYVRSSATRGTKVIGAGVNIEYSKQQIDKLTKMQNILNTMKTKLSIKDHSQVMDLLDQYQNLVDRYDKSTTGPFDTGDIDIVREPHLPEKQKLQQIEYNLSIVRMQMKHWKLQKSMNTNTLYSA